MSVDEAPPVITLIGSTYVEIVQGEEYIDLGAVAQDNIDGYVPLTVNGLMEVDTLTPTPENAPYTVVYTAVDVAGNSASPAFRQVAVLAACESPSYLCADQLPSVICASCTPLQPTADGLPTEIQCTCLNNLNSRLEDELGTTLEVFIPPDDEVPPVLTLTGEGTVGVTVAGTLVMVHEVPLGEEFKPPAVIAHDDTDGDISDQVTSFGVGAIDTSVVTPPDEPFIVTYSVSDQAGNSAAQVKVIII
ncbi:hypothetical protein CYMTET_3326 [Cymbomonas tetramitiformis]|uniref:Pesticidal crystal protein Cry22Aa Ig-like domain-containing protein n=1 Tax=Cymbomonas tetramitiformis TaxID=36881 RepID=A0AAE0LLH9_9CHLO|nr:hypothetical protein CYMTET_3326 [Cymbomonas tetramitiformis]